MVDVVYCSEICCCVTLVTVGVAVRFVVMCYGGNCCVQR